MCSCIYCVLYFLFKYIVFILMFNFVSYVFSFLILCILIVTEVLFYIFCIYRTNWQSSSTLTEVFLCFILSRKSNARVQLAKTWHGLHSSQVLCCSLYCLCVNV